MAADETIFRPGDLNSDLLRKILFVIQSCEGPSFIKPAFKPGDNGNNLLRKILAVLSNSEETTYRPGDDDNDILRKILTVVSNSDETAYRLGDTDNNILRKILASISISSDTIFRPGDTDNNLLRKFLAATSAVGGLIGCSSPPPPEEFESEIWRSINGGAFSLLATVNGNSPNIPTVLMGIDSVLGGIKLHWASNDYTDTTGGLVAGDVWCYKVRRSSPTVGNFSVEACATRDQFFPFNTGTVINHPTWQIVFGDFAPADNIDVTDIDLSGLRAVIGGDLFLDSLFVINNLDITNLIRVTGEIHFSLEGLGGGTLTTLSLPSLVTVGGDFFCDNTAFTSVFIPKLIMLNGTTYAFDTGVLDAPSVERILARGVASVVTSATIFLDGGTNAGLSSLSLQGQADYALLVGLGNTVTINP